MRLIHPRRNKAEGYQHDNATKDPNQERQDSNHV
jgi:hypothetical protein